MLKRHANELSDAELAGYWRDVADTAAALQRVFGAVKIDYAVLANLFPYVDATWYRYTSPKMRHPCSTWPTAKSSLTTTRSRSSWPTCSAN